MSPLLPLLAALASIAARVADAHVVLDANLEATSDGPLRDGASKAALLERLAQLGGDNKAPSFPTQVFTRSGKVPCPDVPTYDCAKPNNKWKDDQNDICDNNGKYRINCATSCASILTWHHGESGLLDHPVAMCDRPFGHTSGPALLNCRHGTVDCVNGLKRGTTTTCAEAGTNDADEEWCCSGTDACTDFTGIVCRDKRSCMGKEACKGATIDAVVNACKKDYACTEAGSASAISPGIYDCCNKKQECRSADRDTQDRTAADRALQYQCLDAIRATTMPPTAAPTATPTAPGATPATVCDPASDCCDDPAFLAKGKDGKHCVWAAEDPNDRCVKRANSDKADKRKVYDYCKKTCAEACDACPNQEDVEVLKMCEHFYEDAGKCAGDDPCV